MRLICKILRTLLLTFVINGILFIYIFSTLSLSRPRSTSVLCAPFAVIVIIQNSNNNCTLYHDTITIQGWNIRLRNYILGHGSVKKRESRGNRSLTSTRHIQRDGDLRILKLLFESFTRHTKKGFARGEGLRLFQMNSSSSTFTKIMQSFKIHLKNGGYQEEVLEKCISKFELVDFTGRERSLKLTRN